MLQIDQHFSDLFGEKNLKTDAKAETFHRRWYALCELYLPVSSENSIWRFNRNSKLQEPSQGWKLHVSATIIEACDLFERVAPFLVSGDVQFKAPNSLEALSEINCGLRNGYHQIGKFITIYPPTEEKAVELARHLHELTEEFFVVSIPFDEQYLPNSSVFYRYGAFSKIEATDDNGRIFPAVRNPAGEFVLDDRRQAIPDWVCNPFPVSKSSEKLFSDTPLGTTYRVFRAIVQRGKGGTYQAFDFSQSQPRQCIVKEGRRNGELAWNGQDGYALVKNEFEILSVLKEDYDAVPKVFSSFELYDNFYFAMEYIEGKSLSDIIKPRCRRFSIKQVLDFAVKISKIIEKIHSAGWIWNDCKPSNLIVTNDNSLRPIDFEGAYPVNQSEPFEWSSIGFSKSLCRSETSSGVSSDLFALGAVIYFLLTGILYDEENPKAIRKLRRDVPKRLTAMVENLLSDCLSNVSKAGKEFEKIKDDLMKSKG